MEVDVGELKVELSEYLGRAAAGEQVVVTDRGSPIARIVPPRRTHLDAFRRHRSDRSVLDVLDEDRG